jgi:chitinase
MIKLSRKSRWLAGLILVTIAALLISGGCVANTLPMITSLALTTEGEINPGMTAQIHCDATDPDEDELSYTWSADGGAISGFSSHVAWTAPEELGAYTITVEVSDGDDTVTDQLVINVLAPNNAPNIESLTTDCPRVRQGHSGTLTCAASDPDGDELTYEWSAERGSISGEGAEVTWTGPNEYGNFLITVTVTDGRGGEAADEISIIVCSCGSAC